MITQRAEGLDKHYSGRGPDRSRDFKQYGTCKSGLLYKSARKLPRKETFLAVQGDLGIIIYIAGVNYVL